MNALHRFLKRMIDVVVSAFALFVCLPFLVIVGLLIRMTSAGPAIFKQQRLGRNGEPYFIWKFRTMTQDAPDLRNADGSAYNSEDDPRVTRIGRMLRKTSLDELPQLLNVLGGEMSLVGPRPDQVDQLKYYSPAERRKLLVKPGITGLAQVSGRNSISWEQRKHLDLQYVENQSIGNDLRILVKTIPYVLLRKDVFVSGSKL
jgi:lipopolysaccharide/colanic/teichoic acid biosynthesis glycosyltransferase